MRERTNERSRRDRKADEEFDFGMTKEAENGSGGSNQRNDPKPEKTKQGGGKAKNGKEAMTKTWSYVVKGLKADDESETTYLDEPNHIKAESDTDSRRTSS